MAFSDQLNGEKQHTYTRFLDPQIKKQIRKLKHNRVFPAFFVHADAPVLAENIHCRCVSEVQIPPTQQRLQVVPHQSSDSIMIGLRLIAASLSAR